MRGGRGKSNKNLEKLAMKLPQANDDAAAAMENEIISIDVLDNDKGGNAKSLYSLNQDDPSIPTNPGDWVVLASGARIRIVDGEVVYDTNFAFESLAEGEVTTDTFTYTIQMGGGATSQATVTIEVTGKNDAPTVSNVSGAAVEDGPEVGIMLAGDDIDSDDDNASLTYTVVSGPAEGSVDIVDNMLNFDPGMDFQDLAEGATRDVTITYQAEDAHGAFSGTATVTVTVTGVNDIAMIAGDSGSVTEDGTLIAAGAVVVNDADAGQSGTDAQTDVAGAYGTFSIDANGVWSYELDNDNLAVQALNDGEMLVDTFPVSSTDGSASANVEITINGTNDSTNADPEPESDVIVASVDTVAVIPAEWLLQNDDDPDGDTLTVTAIDNAGLPAGWSVTPNFSGTDIVSFNLSTPLGLVADLVLNYTVSDGQGGSVSSTVTIKLAAPSTGGDDTVDISAVDYNFSYIEGKDGDDVTTGGSDGVGLFGTVGNDLFIGGDGDDDQFGGLGNDMLFGGAMDGSDVGGPGNANNLHGDVFGFGGGDFTGGNDQLFGGDTVANNMFGDARFVTLNAGDTFTGGNDTLTGGDDTFVNQLLGDGQSVSGAGTFQGGDDILIGGANASNTMIGDASSGAGVDMIGGDDRLVSGQNADDILTGDFSDGVVGATELGGVDTFVFGVDNSVVFGDRITDFEAGKDIVELTGFATLDEFADLAGMWIGHFGFGDLTLDLDGSVDGFGDVIVFTGFSLGDEGTLSGDFIFT